MLRCKECSLKSDWLPVGLGFSGMEYAVIWCNRCGKFHVVAVADHLHRGTPRVLSASGKYTCPKCKNEVALYDMANKTCPACGGKMDEQLVALWD